MRVCNDKSASHNNDVVALFVDHGESLDSPVGGSKKFNISMEKKIERIFREAQTIGWNFNTFASQIMEVLVVLQHRNKVASSSGSARKNNGLGSRL
jgi:hypothetical protein